MLVELQEKEWIVVFLLAFFAFKKQQIRPQVNKLDILQNNRFGGICSEACVHSLIVAINFSNLFQLVHSKGKLNHLFRM